MDTCIKFANILQTAQALFNMINIMLLYVCG